MKELARQAHTLFGIQLSISQIAALEKYEKLLIEWNARVNLTAIQDPEKIRIKHFLDSLSCTKVLKDTPINQVIDIGTGAGFPGLPLKILYPSMALTLVDSIGKKVGFCRFVVEQLGLDGVEVIHERAETLGQNTKLRETYDWSIARAVAAMPVLAEYLLPLVKIGGRMLAMKGESALAEAHTAEKAFHILGGRLHKITPVMLPGVVEEHYLVVVEKVAATPEKYPRKAGMAAKRPL